MSREPSEELRARRRDLQTAEIERAALELFLERGFDAVTAEEIADAAEISRRTFFRYFASKDEILLGDPRRRIAAFHGALAAQPADVAPLVALRNALVAVAEGIERERELALLRARLIEAEPEVFSRAKGPQVAMFQTITTVMAGRMGVPPTDLAPAVYCAAQFMAVQVAASRWLYRGAEGPLVPEVTAALDLLVP